MQVYRLRADANHFLNLVLQDDGDWNLLNLEGQRLADFWKPVRVRPLREGKGNRTLPAGDLPHFGSGILVFSERAQGVLREVIGTQGEWLDLACPEGRYSLLNVVNVVNCLNQDQCEVKRFPSSGRIMDIVKFAFHPEALIGSTIFRVPELVRTDIFVTEAVKSIVDAEKLQGFQFQEIWRYE